MVSINITTTCDVYIIYDEDRRCSKEVEVAAPPYSYNPQINNRVASNVMTGVFLKKTRSQKYCSLE